MFLRPPSKKALSSKSGAGFPTRAYTIDTSFSIPGPEIESSDFVTIGPLDGLTQPSIFSDITPLFLITRRTNHHGCFCALIPTCSINSENIEFGKGDSYIWMAVLILPHCGRSKTAILLNFKYQPKFQAYLKA